MRTRSSAPCATPAGRSCCSAERFDRPRARGSVLPRGLSREENAVRTKSRTRSIVIWAAVALVGAVSWGVIALVRGEQISAAWLIAAALGSYAIAYRFYARFITKK